MAIKRIERYGRTYTYDGSKLISVSKKKKTEQSSMREKTAEKNKGKVYEAGKGVTDRGGTSKKYNLGISAYAKNKKDQETAAKQLDSLYEERYKIQQLDSKNTKAIKAVDNKIKKAEANYKTATNNFEAAKSKRYFDRQTAKYNNLSKDLNYTVHSAYKGKVTADNYWTHNEAAQLSAYINDPAVRKAMDTAALAGSNGTKDSAYPTLKYMNEDEKKNFNFLYNSRNDGGAAAKSYIDDYLSYALNERYYKEAEAEAEKFAKENPVGASAVSVPKSVFGGLGSLDVYGQKIQNAITGSDRPIDWNRPIMANTSGGATKIRETVAEGIENPALKFVYQIGMSMADSAASMPLGSWMGPAMLGGSAGAATMKEAKSNGATDDQALAMGGAAAAFELVFEKIGMDNLFNAKNAAQVDGWFKTILKQANVEGAEEVATSLGNAAADAIIMGDKSEYNRNVQSYLQQGYSKTEAEQLAMQDFAKNLAMDYVGGAFSGGVFGSGSMGINAVTKKISTPTLNKYAGTENIDNVLGREYETSLHQIESRLGEEVAKEIEATMRAANPEYQTLNNNETVISEIPQIKNHYADVITEQKASDLYRSVENRTGLRINIQNLGENINGYISNNEIVVNERIANTEEGARFVVAHELTHTTETLLENEETKQLYNDVLDSAKEFYGTNFDLEVQNRIDLYSANGVYLSEIAAQKEVVADFVANEVFSDYNKLKRFVDRNQSLAQRIFEWIKNLLRKLSGKNDVLVKAYNNFEKAFNEANVQTENKTTRYSAGQLLTELEKLDAEYLAAIERGDMETAQKIVDKAARAAGYTEKGYHGTGEDFNIFSEDKIGKRNVWGKGFYFGKSKGIADDYASWRQNKGGKYRIVNAYLKMQNPFIPHKSSLGSAEEIIDKWFSDMWKTSRDLGIGYIEGKINSSPLDLLQFIAEHNKLEVQDVLKQYGFDSIKDGGEYVVFNSEQIKSADTVVRDDDGNIILPSQRFNEKSNDIRYSLRDVKFSKEINEGVMPPNDVVFEIRYSDAMANPEIKKLYNDAKKGDIQAATELVKKLISKDTIERFRAYGPDVKIIAASASISDSDNVIPVLIAKSISKGFDDIKGTGQEVIDWVFKVPENKKSRKTSIWDRMKEPYPEFDILDEHSYNEFEGSIVALVDDNATTGRTFNGLRLFIEDHGGKIIGYYSLTAGHDESEKMAVTSETWAKLEPVLDEITAFAKKEGIKREITKTGLTEREANELYTKYEKTQTGAVADRSNEKMLRVQAEGSERSRKISINETETTKDGGFSIAEKSQQKFSITEEIPKKKRSSKSKADIDSLIESEPPAEQEKAYFQEIIQTERDKEREAFEAEVAKVDLPKKAQKFFDKKVNEFSKLAFDLMSTLKEDKAGMKADIRIFAEEILRTGKIDNAKLTEIAQRLWQGGVVIDKSFMNQHKELYDRIKDIKINVPQRVRNDIADYNDYRKSIIGLVKTGKDGRQIDDLYQELNSMDASLFPDDIINATDQFLRIVSVREMFKPVATKNAKITEMGYKDYAIREFARLTQEFYAGVMQAHEYRKIVLEGSEDIGYVDQKRNQEAAKHLSESLKAFAAWKKDNLIDEYSEEQARKIVYEDLAIDSLADQTLSGKKINKNLVEKAIPYLRNIKKYEDVTAAYKRQQKARAYAKAKMVTTNSDLWIDKKNGIQYMRETQERIIKDIAGKTDPEGEAMIQELYLDPIHANEAQKQEFMKMLQEKIGALNLTGAERLLTQAYGEGLITKQQLEEFAKSKNKIVIKTVKGDTVYEQGFVGKARNVDVSKVESAVSEFREVYDMLIDRANEVLVANGYARIDKLDNYFPHFSSDQGIFDTIKKVFFGTDMNIDAALPEDINGLTHVFRPGKKFFANFLHRKGSATGLDAYMGFDMYLAGIADVIFHTEDIQNWRALEVVLRNKHTDAETQKRIKDIWNSDLPYNERESQIAGILDAAETGNLSNYVVNLSEYIGVLAGKKSIFDRPSERAFNRRIYATMQAVEGRIASNMLGGNVGSWLTNFIPLVQMNAQVKSKYMLKAVKQTMSSWRNNDGFVSGSDFLINRRGNNPLSKDVFNKISDVAMKPMEYIDMFTTEVCCRAVYMEQIAKGKSHEDAMKIANARTAQVVADRSYGALPTIFNVRNPFAKLFTQFQVEVNNQFSNLFKDIPRRVKEEGAGFLIWALVKYFIGAALFNDLYEKLAGRRPAFDPIGMVKEAYKTYNASKDAGAVAKNVVSNAIEQVPFVGGFLGGGRVPVSSAIPFSGDLDSLTTAITSLASPDVAWEEKKEILNKEISKPVFYLFFPTAGGAVKKVIEGSKIVAQGGAYTYNKEGEKTVKYAVNQEAGDYLQNMIFGAWSSPEAQNYLLSGSKALGVKETQTFDALKELGMKPTEAFDVVKEISDIQGIPNVTGSKAKNRMEAIDDLDVSEDVKYQLYYDMVIPDSKKEDFDVAIKDYGMSKTDLMTAYASTYGIKGDKDSEGKTVSGSKSEKVKEKLDGIENLNQQQRDFMYDTFDVGKNARGMNETEKAQMLENSVIPEAANYDIPKYKAETIQKIQKIGVSANDYAYISDRISAYDDKIDYLKSFSFNESQLRGLVSEMVMGDTAQDKMLVAGEEYGIPKDTYIDAYMFGYESTGSKAERNEKIFNYIQGLKLKEEQKTALYDYIKVYKSKDAGASDSGGKTSKRSFGGGRSSNRKKISVPSAPSVSVKKVSGASGNIWTAAYQNLADKQKRADYEAQLEAINNNVFMTAAQKASAKRRLAKQFNM